MDRLFDFVAECVTRYGMDESHGLLHAKNTAQWAERLLTAEENVTPDERRMAIYAAALHDMCDAKYTDVYQAGLVIQEWLIGEGWAAHEAAALIAIIQSTSYTKLKHGFKVDPQAGPAAYPQHGPWQRAYHIVRHADLLEGYVVRRCMLYTQHSQPGLPLAAYWAIVKGVFENRVLRYVSDGWIFLPQALPFAGELDAIARQDLEKEIY